MMPALFAAILGSFIRFGLTALATWLVTKGVWSTNDSSEFVTGLTIALVTLIWSLWQKYRGHIKFLTALDLPAGSSPEQVKEKMQTRAFTFMLLIAALGFSSTAATCRNGTPRHDSVVNLTATVSAVKGLQDGEKILYDSKKVLALTEEKHKVFNAKLVQVWDAIEAARSAVAAWTPGKQTPQQVGVLLQKINILLDESIEVIGVALPKEVNDVRRAIMSLATAMGGVL